MMSLATMAMYFVVIIVVGLVGLVVYFIWKWRAGNSDWPIAVEILEARANSGVARAYDVAKRVRLEDKGMVIHLKNRNKDTAAIPLNYFLPDKNGQVQLKVSTEDNEIFTPIKFTFEAPNNAELMAEKNFDSVDYRAASKLKYLYAPEPGWFQKYGNGLMLIIIVFLSIVSTAVVYKGQAEVMKVTNEGIAMNRGNYELTQSTAKMVIDFAKAIGMNLTKEQNAAAGGTPW